MTEPTIIYAGDSVTWTRTLADYPAPTWTLGYSLVKADTAYTIATTADGSSHRAAVSTTTTAAYLPGEYTLTAYVTQAGERVTLPGASRVTVRPNPALSTADPRSHARRTLDAIDALLEGRATGDVAAYTINGRSLTKVPLAELITLQSHYRRLVDREDAESRIARGLASGRKIYSRI